MRRYLGILSRPAVALPFLLAVVARLPISMASLGLVLLVQSVRGSYSIAGLVTAVFAGSAAVLTPVWGRLLDRVGQPAVIGAQSAASATLLAALALAIVDGAPDAVLLLLAAGVGTTFPPMSPAMRAAFRAVLEDDDERRAAYALDAVAIETIFVIGPLLLSLLLVVAAPVVPLLVTAVLLAVGGVGYAFTRAARTARSARSHPVEPSGPGTGGGAAPTAAVRMITPGILAVLVVATAVAVGFGQSDVAIAATARDTLGSQSRVGMLFAAIAGGSATGGLAYGARHWPGTDATRLPVVVSGFALGLGVLASVLAYGHAPLPLLLVVLFLAGVCIAPSLIMEANIVDHLAPPHRLNEAQSWLNTSFTAGGSAGTALGGLVLDVGGPPAGFAGAAAAVGVAVVLAFGAQRVWRRAFRADAPAVPGLPASEAA